MVNVTNKKGDKNGSVEHVWLVVSISSIISLALGVCLIFQSNVVLDVAFKLAETPLSPSLH